MTEVGSPFACFDMDTQVRKEKASCPKDNGSPKRQRPTKRYTTQGENLGERGNHEQSDQPQRDLFCEE